MWCGWLPCCLAASGAAFCHSPPIILIIIVSIVCQFAMAVYYWLQTLVMSNFRGEITRRLLLPNGRRAAAKFQTKQIKFVVASWEMGLTKCRQQSLSAATTVHCGFRANGKRINLIGRESTHSSLAQVQIYLVPSSSPTVSPVRFGKMETFLKSPNWKLWGGFPRSSGSMDGRMDLYTSGADDTRELGDKAS